MRYLNRWWLASVFGLSATSIPFSWIRKPEILQGDNVCFFVIYARGGKVPEHSLFHAQAWQRHGYKTTLIVVLDKLDDYAPGPHTDFASGLCIRLNRGYDFGAWAATIRRTPDLENCNLLVIANDSVFGPLNSFCDLLGRIDACHADVIGMTESFEFTHHFQSYMIAFRSAAITSTGFKKFWRNVRTGGRGFVIKYYELRMLQRMQAAGLRTEAIFPMPREVCNPTHKYWRELILAGFPFIKVQLLRENPKHFDLSGWQELVKSKAFDVELIRKHFG